MTKSTGYKFRVASLDTEESEHAHPLSVVQSMSVANLRSISFALLHDSKMY